MTTPVPAGELLARPGAGLSQNAGPVRTAGGIVWREREGELQVELVHRPRYNDWSWPKGGIEPGESTQAAAVREITEETGRATLLGVPLPPLRYRMPSGQWKTVAYWAVRRASASKDAPAVAARLPVRSPSTKEIDNTRWLPAAEARNLLTRHSDRKPLDALVAAHQAGELASHAVVIARHGQALPRAQWRGESDGDRPLTALGAAHAAALVPVLAAYGVRRVVSSRWERCAATVAPYVQATGLSPWFSDNLTERDHERSPARVAATVRELLAGGKSAVLCTHRPVLPTVLEVLAAHARRSVAEQLPSHDPYLEPGAALVAHVVRSRTEPAGTDEPPRVVALELVTPYTGG